MNKGVREVRIWGVETPPILTPFTSQTLFIFSLNRLVDIKVNYYVKIKWFKVLYGAAPV